MANVRWLGGAQAVAQVSTVQITAYHASTRYSLTFANGKTVSCIAAGSVNATATALAAAWNASTDAEFAEVTASANTDTVTLTADTAGVPFAVTSSVSGGTGTIGAVTAGTASAGPNDWSTAANWSGGAVPGSDDVWIDSTVYPILYSLDQSAVTLTSLTVSPGVEIGLPEVNATGGYAEYRQRWLKVGVTTCTIGRTTPTATVAASGTVRLHLHTVQSLVTTYSGTVEIHGGSHVSNVLRVFGGTVYVAYLGTETATFATVTVGPAAGESPVAYLGTGCTLTTVTLHAGSLELNSTVTTFTQDGGSGVWYAGSCTTTNLRAGSLVYNASGGSLGTVSIDSGAVLDCSQVDVPRTIAQLYGYPGGAVMDPYGSLTHTNPPQFLKCCPGTTFTYAFREDVKLTIVLL